MDQNEKVMVSDLIGPVGEDDVQLAMRLANQEKQED